MAAGIDVFFTGLMLICLDGQPNCPVSGNYRNSAWVVKTDDRSAPCKFNDTTETTLHLQFDERALTTTYVIDGWVTCTTKDYNVDCKFNDLAKLPKLCIDVDPPPAPADQKLKASLQWLLRIDEVDRRFKAVRTELLANPSY